MKQSLTGASDQGAESSNGEITCAGVKLSTGCGSAHTKLDMRQLRGELSAHLHRHASWLTLMQVVLQVGDLRRTHGTGGRVDTQQRVTSRQGGHEGACWWLGVTSSLCHESLRVTQ